MPNHLIDENSPYLLQHKDNPVDWYPWNEEALSRARQLNKPIFLSIGYAACHWCHVMEAESFTDPSTAAIMNEYFVCIKVDREERPDLDSLYMNAVVAITGQGGWPMSVFLTPDGQPFFGGTYFPPVSRYNMPAFRDVLLSVARTWVDERSKVQKAGSELVEALQKNTWVEQYPHTESLSEETLVKALQRLEQNYDWEYGGWGQAPKFPQPMAINFILMQVALGRQISIEPAEHALEHMALGGMYDVIGGGFCRYSTDNTWLVPHFEKMLYDNALLARAYLLAYLITGRAAFRAVCEETIDFVLRELTGPEGGFFSSLDADSEGEEGKFYTWSFQEIKEIIQKDEDFQLFSAAYGVTESGNFEGMNVLHKYLDDEMLSRQFNLSTSQVAAALDKYKKLLFRQRSRRIRPNTDDKIILAWNGLFLTVLSEAARYLNRQDYLQAAQKNAGFLLNSMQKDGRLYRSWRLGKAQHKGFLEDYGSLILGLVSLYQGTCQTEWIAAAYKLTNSMVHHFYDENNGFFDTPSDQEQLFMRPKDLQDNATPSGSSLAIQALLQVGTLYGNHAWRSIAEKTMGALQTTLSRYPTAFSNWLLGMTFALTSVKEVAILGDPDDPRTRALVGTVWSNYRPDLIFAAAAYPPPEGSPTLLANRPLINGQPTAYVCRNFVCKLPVTEPEALRTQIV